MATSLAAQLSIISAHTDASLNLKAQKAKHSKSLIFEPRIAASQSFDTIYTLCHEGFEELCLLDNRFVEFQRDIFSEQSQDEDRSQMSAVENTELDRRLESFLGLVGGRLRLNPAIKATEWLVRRFRIYEFNTSFLLMTFLPYHTLPIFATLLSILPENVAQEHRFLQPYIRSLTSPPRHSIVRAATNSVSFASALNAYVLRICRARQHHPALIAFWATVMTEAIGGMMDNARSGRKGVQHQNETDIILRLIPTLNEGLAMRGIPDLRLGCYMLLSVMVAKGGLEDNLLGAMMDAVVLGWESGTFGPGLVCLSNLAQHRGSKPMSKRLTMELVKVKDLPEWLVKLSKQQRVDKLGSSFCLALVDRVQKSGDIKGVPTIQHIIQNQVLTDSQTSVIVKALVLAAYHIEGNNDAERIRCELASSLVAFTQLPGHVGSIVKDALEHSGIDMDELELRLQTKLRPVTMQASPSEDVEMDGPTTDRKNLGQDFQLILEQLPKKTVNELSFLSHDVSHIYPDLCHAFLVSASNSVDLDAFDSVPILRRESALDDTVYLSFYIKTWSGPHPVVARASALQMATRAIANWSNSSVDLQAVLPYAIAALRDPAPKVRRAAAQLLLAIDQIYVSTSESKKKGKLLPRWASEDLYGTTEIMKEVKWLSADVAARFVGELLVPALEECILDPKHIQSVFERSLNSSSISDTPRKQENGRLPQSARSSVLSSLASHIFHTPLYLVKLRLLGPLNQVRSVAGVSRTKVLLPVLEQWANLKTTSVTLFCQDERIEPTEFDEQALLIVAPNDKDGLHFLAKIISGDIAVGRQTLLSAVFSRLRTMWSSLKGDLRLSTAQMLMDSIYSSTGELNEQNEAVLEGSADLLRSTPLSTDILLSFLDQLPTATKLTDTPPATKRRRVSHGEVAKAPAHDSKLLAASIKKVTFVLQLVDNSEPGKHPELLRGLFNVLVELQHFKAQVGSELAYLQGLVLGSLLSILKAHKSKPSMALDRSAIRADLLVDCIQKTTSPQVQNAALLLVACLADTAPEVVLHSVMPIFTFMGSSVLRQNDEYSAHVISQTIHEVIPPLVESLRREKGNPVTGAAELLLSFVAAYEHVPAHRRKGLFTSLVQTLGPADFLFALLAMLVEKYSATESIKIFSSELSGSFSVEIQLQSAVKYLELIGDVLKPKPTYSSILLGARDGKALDPHRIALEELSLLPHLLSQKQLVTQTGKLLDRDDMDASRIRDLYSVLLEKNLALADTLKESKTLHVACGDVLESLLGLLSTAEFVKSVESLLDRPNESLRRKILRSLEVRIDQESASNVVSRVAMLAFLPQLTAIIRESQDVLYKHTAVACVDKISEKYGKKDLEAVSAAAETIASGDCLGQADERLRVMALLCLASLVEILRDGIVFVLPTAIPKALEYMEASVKPNVQIQKLHNAGYSFISALVHHLPYMITGGYLDKLLEISNISAEADLDEEADESRVQCLQLAAKQVDAKSMFGALDKDWGRAAITGPTALREFLEILSTAIEKHPRAVVTKYSTTLAKIFQNSLDLRRRWISAADDRFDPETMYEIEAFVNAVALKMIYKFNDATLRPIFSALIAWATSGLPKKDKSGRILRLQSTYGFMIAFFGDLKSIVAPYGTYLLETAVDAINNVNAKDDSSKELWSRVLRTLAKCFEHDQDDFWQAPAHFSVVAPVLCAQFANAASLPLVQDLIPAVVELAAVADAQENHKELNSAILKHLRSENASVRLAGIKCEQELTDRLGEEWLSMLPEMLPFISELQDDDDDVVEKETHRWIVKIENVLGESLDSMLQ